MRANRAEDDVLRLLEDVCGVMDTFAAVPISINDGTEEDVGVRAVGLPADLRRSLIGDTEQAPDIPDRQTFPAEPANGSNGRLARVPLGIFRRGPSRDCLLQNWRQIVAENRLDLDVEAVLGNIEHERDCLPRHRLRLVEAASL